MIYGFLLQILLGACVSIKLAVCAFLIGLPIGFLGALLESISNKWLRYIAASFIFVIRGLPELLVLFFIYFGLTILFSKLFHHYVDINAFLAGVIALGLIVGAYASQVFQSAFKAIDRGQVEAGKAIGFGHWQVLFYIQLPQLWRHALPNLGNLWLTLLKDTAIVSLIGLQDMMSKAKIAASSLHQPFTFYLIVAAIYLVITTVSQTVINRIALKQNEYLHP